MNFHFLFILLSVMAVCTTCADDFETPGERTAIERQLKPFSLPGWHALQPVIFAAQESPDAVRKRVQLLNEKLDAIKIAQIDFQDVPIRDVVAWLRDAAKRNDLQGAESNKGVNIVMKFSDPAPGPVGSFHLRDVTLREALTQLSAPFKIRVEVMPYAVALRLP